jgi:hypothetical protein
MFAELGAVQASNPCPLSLVLAVSALVDVGDRALAAGDGAFAVGVRVLDAGTGARATGAGSEALARIRRTTARLVP